MVGPPPGRFVKFRIDVGFLSNFCWEILAFGPDFWVTVVPFSESPRGDTPGASLILILVRSIPKVLLGN